MTTENPRVVRLTRGKLTKLNFGVALQNVLELDVTDAAFVRGSNELRAEYVRELPSLIEALKGQDSTLKLTYHNATTQSDTRLETLSARIQELWRDEKGDYKLNIERVSVRAGYSAQITGTEE